MTGFLEVHRVDEHFVGVAALSDCSLSLGRGSVTGIIGPNGAVKTTLLNVITGLVKADTGYVRFDNHDIIGLPIHQIASLELVRTFQIAREMQGLTVLENLLLSPPHQVGEQLAGALFMHRAVKQQDRENAIKARDILRHLGLWNLADQSVAALSESKEASRTRACAAARSEVHSPR